MNRLLLVPFGLAMTWGAIATFYGVVETLAGSGDMAYLAAVFLTSITTVVLFSTRQAWEGNKGDEQTGCAMQIVWLVALVCSLCASYVGNEALVTAGRSDPGVVVLLIGLTVFSTGSPIIVSKLWRQMDGDGQSN